MATCGSLCSTFVPARHVRLAVKLSYAITLSARFPFAPREPLDPSVTFWEGSAPLKLPTRYCSKAFLPFWLDYINLKGGISLTTPAKPKSCLQSLPPILRSKVMQPISSCSKAPGVFLSCCR